MKLFQNTWRLFLLFIGMLAMVCRAAPLPDRVTMAVDNYLPYVNFDTRAGQKPGYMVAITQRIFARQGISLHLIHAPYARSLQLGKQRQIDGLFAQRYVEGTYYAPTTAHGISRVCLYVRREPTELAGVRKIGLNMGYDIASLAGFSDVQKLVRKHRKQLVRLTGDEPVKRYTELLLAGRIDGFIENDYVASWYFRRLAQPPLPQTCSVGQAMYILFFTTSPDGNALAGLIDEGIKQLRASGELGRILEEYGLEDWQ
ncbi:substrate-binding periplasmic protein [Alteromonas sp. CYL-A6]|uniref:substrate-binding periplasmic protein n=1 Tax=Alteromonas nitratireducens TaxID=3390813 RepID=UPI0034B6C6EC